jgi:hypothetical protein
LGEAGRDFKTGLPTPENSSFRVQIVQTWGTQRKSRKAK